jgi:hypothetical protein
MTETEFVEKHGGSYDACCDMADDLAALTRFVWEGAHLLHADGPSREGFLGRWETLGKEDMASDLDELLVDVMWDS